ncbi:MAG: MarR family transcriptional regulator [Burkholderiales bacterium]|nr:MarR family transcriptional regulator [Burkholderiales bacterium]
MLDQARLQRLIGYNLRRAEVVMRGRVGALLAQSDLRAVEYSILSLLAANAEVTQKDLGEALAVKRPNMVALIDRLETRGLVTRAVLARDRRNQVLTLTPAGTALLAQTDARLDALENAAFADWSAAERAQVARMLRRIAGT